MDSSQRCLRGRLEEPCSTDLRCVGALRREDWKRKRKVKRTRGIVASGNGRTWDINSLGTFFTSLKKMGLN